MKKRSLAVQWGWIVLAVLFVSTGWAQPPDNNENLKLSMYSQVPAALVPVSGYQVAQAEDTEEAAADEAVPNLALWGGAPTCDHSWEDSFARPVTNFRFDHPFIWNELRPMFVEHSFPKDSALGGGKLRIYTSQFQLKLSERVGLVALKAGFVEFNPGARNDDEGWTDLAAGLKFNLVNDPAQQFALSLGTVYEMTQGTTAICQGEGDGLWDLYLSAAKGYGPVHWITTAGFDIPNNRSADNPVFHYHAHLDYALTSCFAPLVKLNGYHYFETADRNRGMGTELDFEGFDYGHFGSSNAGGDHVTMGVGFRWDLFPNAKFGTAYEWSLTDRKDLFEDRVTCDISYRF